MSSPTPGGPAAASGPTGPALLVGADRAAFVAALVDRLRRAGLTVSVASAGALARALTAIAAGPAPAMITDRRRLYWIARVTLVRDRDGLVIFDEVFRAVFDDAVFSLDPAAMRNAADRQQDQVNRPVPGEHAAGDDAEDTGLPWATLPRMALDEGGPDDDGAPVWIPRPNWESGIAQIPFDQLDADQLAMIEHWLDKAITSWPRRRSRRERPDAHGRRIDLRQTLAQARRSGFELADIARRGPVQRDRPVIMVCDVSQSMQPYTSAYLHLMRVIVERGRGEAFAFATSLTRMTAMLAGSSIADVVAQASARVVDRYGGTRIAAGLDALLRSRHAQQLRGAICIIASDGWDSDPAEQMTAAMQRIARRAHRVIWLNPRAGQPGYRPLVAGMAAALPYCDDFLPAGRLADLPAVIAAITQAVAGPAPATRTRGALRAG